jgi:phosphoserine phosphatase RsbU/P
VLRRLEPTGPAVGLLPGLSFNVDHLTLDPGDSLLAFTDGVTDARSPAGESYGEDRLFSTAARPDASAVSLLDSLDADLLAHTAGAEPFDDITLLALRRS